MFYFLFLIAIKNKSVYLAFQMKTNFKGNRELICLMKCSAELVMGQNSLRPSIGNIGTVTFFCKISHNSS